MRFLLQFYDLPSITIVNLFMTRNFCCIFDLDRLLLSYVLVRDLPYNNRHKYFRQVSDVRSRHRTIPPRFPQITPRHFYLRSADERIERRTREKKGKRTAGDFEISTGADLTLENTDDANGRRTKELEARYNPRAVEDYEWPGWLQTDNRNAIGQPTDSRVANFLAYPSVFWLLPTQVRTLNRRIGYSRCFRSNISRKRENGRTA